MPATIREGGLRSGAAMRHPLEAERRRRLDADQQRTYPANVTATSTHDTVTRPLGPAALGDRIKLSTRRSTGRISRTDRTLGRPGESVPAPVAGTEYMPSARSRG